MSMIRSIVASEDAEPVDGEGVADEAVEIRSGRMRANSLGSRQAMLCTSRAACIMPKTGTNKICLYLVGFRSFSSQYHLSSAIGMSDRILPRPPEGYEIVQPSALGRRAMRCTIRDKDGNQCLRKYRFTSEPIPHHCYFPQSEEHQRQAILRPLNQEFLARTGHGKQLQTIVGTLSACSMLL
jgi:hypothetical protein